MNTPGAAMRRPAVISWPLAVVFTIGAIALATSSVVGTVVLAGCILAALMGPVRAIQALTVATLVGYANPAIIKVGDGEGVLMRLVLLAAVLRMVPTIRSSDLRILWPVWLFSVAEALTSLKSSPAVYISMLKVLEFICGITAVLVAYNHVKPSQLAGLQRWMITFGLTVIGLSALTLLKPGIGLGGDGGLEGLLNQPQALGILMAPFAAWAIAGTLLMRRSATRLELWVALVLVVLILLSKARTAGFGAGFGVLVVVAARAIGRRRAGQATLGRPIVVCLLACIGLAVFAAATGGLSKIVNGYLYKGTEGQVNTLNQAFYNSRGGGALGEWQDFLAQPLFGNGFGVYPDGHFPSGVVRVDGIPISAPIEKGFLPTAILQEGGAVGGALLLLIIGLLWQRTWRNTDLRWRAMFVACLGINVGECVFMSPGGIGIFDWLLLGLAMFSYRTTQPLPLVLRPAATADASDGDSPTLARRPEPQFGI